MDGSSQNSTEASNAHPLCFVQITDEPNGIQSGSSLLNVDVLLCRQIEANIDAVGFPISSHRQPLANAGKDSLNTRIDRQSSVRSYDMESQTYFTGNSLSSAGVYACQIHNDWLSLPNITSQI